MKEKERVIFSHLYKCKANCWPTIIMSNNINAKSTTNIKGIFFISFLFFSLSNFYLTPNLFIAKQTNKLQKKKKEILSSWQSVMVNTQ